MTIDPQIHLILKEKASWDIGIHPAAIVKDGVSVPRGRYGDGWNDALLEIEKIEALFLDWYKKIPQEIKQHIETLLIADILELSNREGDIKMYVNANDTFAYASADAVEVQMNEVIDLNLAYQTFKGDGVLAWMSLKEKVMPLKELQSDSFIKAYESLKGEKDEKLLGHN